MIYADNAATTKLSPHALEVMMETAQNTWGNPSSLYELGQRAQEALSDARSRMAALLGADAKEIYFTSGGSEGDNHAIRSCARLGAAKGKRHIISTAFEHHAVLHTLKRLEKEGYEVTYLPVHENGIVTADHLPGLGLVGDQVVVLLRPGEGQGTHPVGAAVAAELLLLGDGVGAVSELDLLVLGDGLMDGVHVVVDGLVHALDPVLHEQLPLHEGRLVDAHEARQLFDELHGLALRDELAGLDAVDEELDLRQLEVPRRW